MSVTRSALSVAPPLLYTFDVPEGSHEVPVRRRGIAARIGGEDSLRPSIQFDDFFICEKLALLRVPWAARKALPSCSASSLADRDGRRACAGWLLPKPVSCAGADWPYAVNEIATAISEVVNVNLKELSAFLIVRFYRGAVRMSHAHLR